jgi:osmotically-inducible protein OsmY
MEYARDDIALRRGGWSRAARIQGAVAGTAREVRLEPGSWHVLATLVSRQRARQLGRMGLGEAGATEADASALRVTAATRVVGPQGAVGRVAHLWVSRGTGALTHAVLRTHEALRIVPAEALQATAQGALRTTLGHDEFLRLPLYRPDEAITADVRAAVAAVLAEPRARRAVKVHVSDGQVLVTGEVDTREQVAYVRAALAEILGVRGVTLDLVAQEDLAASVEAQLLAAMNGAAAGRVQVFTEHSIVILEGTVPTAAARAAAEQAALRVAGARVVVNNLQIEGDAPARGGGTGPLVRNR